MVPWPLTVLTLRFRFVADPRPHQHGGKNLDTKLWGEVQALRPGSARTKLNLPDSELAAWPRCSPVHLLVRALASLLSTHRDLWRSRI